MDPVREALWRLGGGPPLRCFYAARGETKFPENWPHLGSARTVVLCTLARNGTRGRWQVVEVHGEERAQEYLLELRAAGVPLELARARECKRVLRAAVGHIIRELPSYWERGMQTYDPEIVTVTFNGIPVVPVNAKHITFTATMPGVIRSLTINGIIKL